MPCIEKQLVLNRLKLPVEIICIIKDYSFMDITMSSKKKKDIILRLISITTWSSSRDEDDDHHYFFWIEEDPKCSQFQATFCNKCGNYFYLGINYPDKITCQCFIENFNDLNI